MNTEKIKSFVPGSTGSRRYAWAILILSFVLSMYALYKGQPMVSIAVWPAALATGGAVYANKQYQERKTLELKNNEKLS